MNRVSTGTDWERQDEQWKWGVVEGKKSEEKASEHNSSG